MAAATTKRKRRASATLRGVMSPRSNTPAAERLDNLKVEVFQVAAVATGGSLLLGAILLAKNSIQKSVKENKQEEVASQVTTLYSPAYYAERLRTAFNPSGFEWMRDYDTTDVPGVMNTFAAIPTYAKTTEVFAAYRTLTGRRLSDDLRGELSASEYDKVWDIIQKKPKK